MKKLIILTSILLSGLFTYSQTYKTKFDDAALVLNLGTFHMGYTPDADKTEFDEHNKENIKEVHKIAKMIAEFKPTVIVVETTPKYQKALEKQYQNYLQNPAMTFKNPDEIKLLAYEVGRLSGTKRIYGIDYKEGYNYNIFNDLQHKVDSVTETKYGKMTRKNEQKYLQALGKAPNVLEMLKGINSPYYLDYLININADILTYASTKGKAEGAHEAAKFYHRNLVMYSNLNQIKLDKDDRVFILMGATHTAFFNEWIKRSPKYKLIDVFDYLK